METKIYYVKDGHTLVMENVRMIWRNLSGAPDRFNKDGGKRSFHVVIEDSETARKLIDEGFYLKVMSPRTEDPDEEVRYSMKINVNFRDGADNRNPLVKMYSGKVKTVLNADTIGTLDFAEIKQANIAVNLYRHDPIPMAANSTITPYLASGEIFLEEELFPDRFSEEEFPQEF